jgi:hypothetical protein
MNFSEPFLEPYSRHILVCVGGFCSPDRRGRELYAMLPALLQREGLLFGPERVKRGETPCLGVSLPRCSTGSWSSIFDMVESSKKQYSSATIQRRCDAPWTASSTSGFCRTGLRCAFAG